MKSVVLDYRNILEYAEDTIEYLFVDKVEVQPGKSAAGVKHASLQDWYFKIHFPDNPVMPGVFVMEAIMQTGLFVISTMPEKKHVLFVFRECEKVKLRKSVRPGDVLQTNAVLQSYKRGIAKFYGEAYIDGELACSMSFTMVAPEELPNI